MDWFWIGGEGPKDIPSPVYMYLLNTLKAPPESLPSLSSVQKVGLWNGRLVTFIRIYYPHGSDEALQVDDFTSLDRQPELILYEGYWEKDSGNVFLECKTTPKHSPQRPE